MELLTSRENPRVKRVAKLLSERAQRESSGLFVAEGVRLCMDAVTSGVVIREVYATKQALAKRPELENLTCVAAECYIISEPVAEKIADTKSPQGVFAVCVTPTHKPPEVFTGRSRYLLLASLQDPGNVGAIIRAAEALGLDGVCISADCPELYAPKTLRASMGGVFRLPVWVAADMRDEIARLTACGLTVYAAALEENARRLGGFSFKGACAALLGNEGAGLNQDLVKACAETVTIPMTGRADSLGVAMAAGILAWEMSKDK